MFVDVIPLLLYSTLYSSDHDGLVPQLPWCIRASIVNQARQTCGLRTGFLEFIELDGPTSEPVDATQG